MNLRYTPYLILAALALFVSSPSRLFSQVETVYHIPPALAASNGRALVGTQAGKIFRASTGVGGRLTLDTATADTLLLPEEVLSIWTLSIPNPRTTPDLVVGLVSYSSDAGPQYGIIRSTDFGGTWTLQKPDAFVNSAFPVGNDWVTQPLSEIIWLDDALHGWVYGRNGIIRTTDGGLTWELMRAVAIATERIWGMDFKSPTEGMAVIGLREEQRFHTTTDGGRTWSRVTSTNLFPFRIVHVDYVGEEYRALVMDRFQLTNNSYMYYSPDGRTWTSRRLPTIQREQSNMSDIMWADSNTAFMVMRSGDIFRSTNNGRIWENIQAADSVAYPINPNTGWGQRSVLLDNSSIVHVNTNFRNGTIDRFEQWLVRLSAAPDDSRNPAGASIGIVPNPTMGTAVMQIDLLRPVALQISVVDPLGRRLLHTDLPTGAAGTLRFDLDVSTLPAGAYRVVVTGEGVAMSSPLLVVE